MIELLMYKARVELAANRADFVSLLFSRKRPRGLDENSTAEELFDAFNQVRQDHELFEENLTRVKKRLSLTFDDSNTLDRVYGVFYSLGPSLNYASNSTPVNPAPSGPAYEELMKLTDENGRNWSFLAAESNYKFVKEMQQKN